MPHWRINECGQPASKALRTLSTLSRITSLLLSALQPHWLAFNSWKHCTPPPTSGHLHCSFLLQHSPSPHHLLFSLDSWLPDGDHIYSFVCLPQHLKQTQYCIMLCHVINICQTSQIINSLSNLSHHYTLGVTRHKAQGLTQRKYLNDQMNESYCSIMTGHLSQ